MGGQADPKRPRAARPRFAARLALAVAVPALLLAGTEALLRFSGCGFPAQPFIRLRTESGPSLGSNPRFGWRFFPRELARTMPAFAFPAAKGSGTVRIFVLGESAAQGTPDPAFSFGRMLRVMLEEAYPGKRFEVVTAAMPAINSHAVLPVARACLRHDPDLLVVYAGNNEVLGPYGAGTVFTPFLSDLRAIRLNVALRGTRVGQLAAALRERGRPPPAAPQGWRGLEMFLEHEVREDDPALTVVRGHFERNLADICRAAEARGVPVALCTVASNLRDCPPFASKHREGLRDDEQKEWDRWSDEGGRLEAAGDAASALDAYRRAAAIDAGHAGLAYRIGRCAAALGRTNEAAESFVRARDLDTLRFRADTGINDGIRRVAAREASRGVRLVDVERIASADGPPGSALFLEHVHFAFDGNHLVARSVFEAAAALLAPGLGPPPAGAPASRDDCAGALAYTDWERARIERELRTGYLERPPFTNQLGSDERIRASAERERALRAGFDAPRLEQMRAAYRQAVERRPDDAVLRVKHGLFLTDAVADLGAAEAEFRAALLRVPHDGEALANLGYVIGRSGRLEEAEGECRRAVRILPYNPDALYNLGLCLHLRSAQARTPDQGRRLVEESIGLYTRSLACNPSFAQAWNNKATLLVQLRRMDEAFEAFKAGIEAEPGHLDLRYNYAVALNMAGRTDAAAAQLRAALKAHPDAQKVREALRGLSGRGGMPR